MRRKMLYGLKQNDFISNWCLYLVKWMYNINTEVNDMFSKNLTYYRLKKAMSKAELAKQCNLSSMAITHYENGDRKPDMEVLKTLANVLGVRVADFLVVHNEGLHFQHGEFRKNSSLGKEKREFIRASVEEYFNRFMSIVEILGGEVLPLVPQTGSLTLVDDIEENAKTLRRHLNLAEDGPIDNLVELLENKGILVYECEHVLDNFSGMNGFVNERPYIAFNKKMSPERNRSTIAHELAHLMFFWPMELEEKKVEELATSISGAFLFPMSDAKRELGLHRLSFSKDMLLVAKEYGISAFMLVKRARIANILSESAERNFYLKASGLGWRKNEPSRIPPESPSLFRQFVFRAVNENEISIPKGAELLNVSYDEIASNCCFNEDEEWSV